MDDLAPAYEGENLVNLLAELEIRLTGRSPTRGLLPVLADLIPHQRNYVLVINDGLGAHQLAHPSAGRLRRSQRAGLLPTQTNRRKTPQRRRHMRRPPTLRPHPRHAQKPNPLQPQPKKNHPKTHLTKR